MSVANRLAQLNRFIQCDLFAMAVPVAKRAKAAPAAVVPAAVVPAAVPEAMPPPPMMAPGPIPTREEVTAGTAPELDQYMVEVVKYASQAILEIHGKPVQDIEPLRIDADAGAAMRSYKLHWDNVAARTALCTTHWFEGGGVATWFEPLARACTWGDAELPGFKIGWPQVLSALTVWSHERFLASAEEESPPGVSLFSVRRVSQCFRSVPAARLAWRRAKAVASAAGKRVGGGFPVSWERGGFRCVSVRFPRLAPLGAPRDSGCLSRGGGGGGWGGG